MILYNLYRIFTIKSIFGIYKDILKQVLGDITKLQILIILPRLVIIVLDNHTNDKHLYIPDFKKLKVNT